VHVACTLLWRFSAHSRAGRGSAIVQLPARADKVELVCDLVVGPGEVLRLEGLGISTLVLGAKQLRVERGGRLELVGLSVEDSTGSSAIFNEGSVSVVNSRFVGCITSLNYVMRVGEPTVPPGSVAHPPLAGALLLAVGGSIFGVSAELVVRGSRFIGSSWGSLELRLLALHHARLLGPCGSAAFAADDAASGRAGASGASATFLS
jgi:hypothetical protein